MAVPREGAHPAGAVGPLLVWGSDLVWKAAACVPGTMPVPLFALSQHTWHFCLHLTWLEKHLCIWVLGICTDCPERGTALVQALEPSTAVNGGPPTEPAAAQGLPSHSRQLQTEVGVLAPRNSAANPVS